MGDLAPEASMSSTASERSAKKMHDQVTLLDRLSPREKERSERMPTMSDSSISSKPLSSLDEGLVQVSAGQVTLAGNLLIPRGATGIVLFAHGSGSSRFSSRNRYVASFLREGRLGTFLIDLLTQSE